MKHLDELPAFARWNTLADSYSKERIDGPPISPANPYYLKQILSLLSDAQHVHPSSANDYINAAKVMLLRVADEQRCSKCEAGILWDGSCRCAEDTPEVAQAIYDEAIAAFIADDNFTNRSKLRLALINLSRFRPGLTETELAAIRPQKEG
jgi:hypothetical protein